MPYAREFLSSAADRTSRRQRRSDHKDEVDLDQPHGLSSKGKKRVRISKGNPPPSMPPAAALETADRDLDDAKGEDSTGADSSDEEGAFFTTSCKDTCSRTSECPPAENVDSQCQLQSFEQGLTGLSL